MRAPLVVLLLASLAISAPAQTLLGPLPYVQLSNSPLDKSGSFQLETFEDGLLNVPGVTSSDAQIVNPSAITDSVDADDGVIDGFGLSGHTWFTLNGSPGITFTFSAAALGGLPTQVGVVWTDGGNPTNIVFTAFDGSGAVLGNVVLNNHGDGNNAGGTAEDRFFGVVYAGGVGSIKVSSTGGGIELDHLQYGTPGPWSSVGGGKAGPGGQPLLAGTGPLTPSSANQLALTAAKPSSTATLVTGLSALNAPFKGGTLVPQPMLLLPLPTNASGAVTLPFVLPALPAGTSLWFQFWVQDAGASFGLSASNGVKGVTG